MSFLLILLCCITPLVKEAGYFLLLILVLFILGVLLWKVIKKAKTSVCVVCFFVLLVIWSFLVFQLGIALEQLPAWDFGRVQRGAWELVKNGYFVSSSTIEYFLESPNNFFPAVYLFRWLAMLTAWGVKPEDAVLILNTLSLSLTILFVFLTFMKIKRPQQGLLTSIYCFLFAPMFLYASIYYTDTLSMVYVSVILYLSSFLLSKDTKLFIQILCGSLLGLVAAIGYLLKGTPIIAAVAALICILLQDYRKFFISFATFLVCFFLVFGFWNEFSKDNNYLPKQQEANEGRLTASHYIMMGLNGRGGYSPADHEFSTSIPTISERKAENLRVIKERIKAYGFIGVLDHLKEKIKYTWGDGGYYAPQKIAIEPISDSPLLDYLSYDAKYYIYTSKILAASQLWLLLLIVLGALGDVLNKETEVGIILLSRIALVGLAVFLLIWETRSRYLVNYAPYLSILGADTFRVLSDKFIRRTIKGKRH